MNINLMSCPVFQHSEVGLLARAKNVPKKSTRNPGLAFVRVSGILGWQQDDAS